MPSKKPKQREVDALIEVSAQNFTTSLSLIAKSKIKVWKVIFIVVFVIGFASAAVLSTSNQVPQSVQVTTTQARVVRSQKQPLNTANLLGDVNANKRLDCVDLGIIAEYIKNDQYYHMADLDQDGDITQQDIGLLSQQIDCRQARSFTYHLDRVDQLNFISFPVNIEEARLDRLFGPILDKITLVINNKNDSYYDGFYVGQDIKRLKNGIGYGVRVNQPVSLTVTGLPLPKDFELSLGVGNPWIGYFWKGRERRKAIPIKEIEELKAVDYTQIWHYALDGSLGEYIAGADDNDFDSLEMGHVYNVRVVSMTK